MEKIAKAFKIHIGINATVAVQYKITSHIHPFDVLVVAVVCMQKPRVMRSHQLAQIFIGPHTVLRLGPVFFPCSLAFKPLLVPFGSVSGRRLVNEIG
jgi:hypothetical protein